MFKKSMVDMLPTNEKANNKYFSNELLLCVNKETKNVLKFGNNSPFDILGGYFKPQHLYFLSDEEIKEGDWYIFNWAGEKDIQKFSKEQYNDRENHKHLYNNACKKIIATTDKSLVEKVLAKRDEIGDLYKQFYLPQPSQSFLEKFVEEYNKGNQIKEVMVEYEGMLDDNNVLAWGSNKLKVNPKDNTITIRKMKDSWNRDEVVELMERSIDRGVQLQKDYKVIHKKDHINKWIEENL